MFESYTPSNRRNPRFWFYAFLALCPTSLLFVYMAAAPILTVWDMSDAAQEKDGTRFASYIDFPKFKENLKAELNATVAEKMAKDSGMKDNPFSGLGMLLAPTLINNMVDAFVTPAGIERMMAGQFTPQAMNTQTLGNKRFLENVGYEMGYSGVNEFRISITTEPNQKKPTILIFERQNLISWRLVNLKLP